jgi:DNA-binding transcriptional MerR regulator
MPATPGSAGSITVKAIRHYHQHRLIDEPRRDSSGYRRYGSADLLRLVHIRTLAGAGVPLAEIGAILDAAPDRFAAALVDAERRLTDRIDDLIARRETLRRLATGLLSQGRRGGPGRSRWLSGPGHPIGQGRGPVNAMAA